MILRDYLDHESKVEDERLFQHFRREIETAIAELKPDIVAISVLFTISSSYLEQLSNMVRDISPSAVVVAGGGMPSAGYEQVLSVCPAIDAVCKGEGEIPLGALVDSVDRPGLFVEHPSWVNRDGVRTKKIPAHTFIQNLDEIPMFDYSVIDLDDYNSRSLDKRSIGKPKREMAIHTSRGCPFSCVFCSNPTLHGQDMRVMSVERVLAEVTRMRDENGLTVLMIEDDHFFHNVKRAKEILRGLAELEISIEFPNGVAVAYIDEEVAELFVKAGVAAVALAIESGSDYVLNKIIKKPLRKKHIKAKVSLLRKHDILIHAFIVIGLPGELDEHREETHQLLLESELDWVHIFCAVPIIGSRLYDICKDNDYFDSTDETKNVVHRSIIRAPGVDPEEIEKLAYFLNLSVNFVNNYNMKVRRYDKCVKYFQNVSDKYPDHAFSRFFLAKCFEDLGEPSEKIEHEYARFEKICSGNPFWRDHAATFGLAAPSAMAHVSAG